MPVLFRVRGYRLFFYANEGNPIEPAHVHVEKDGLEAKFWIVPDVRVAYNDGFNARGFAGVAGACRGEQGAHRKGLE